MPVVIDSRGVRIFLTDDQARAEATELIQRSEAAITYADQPGWGLSDADAERVRNDLNVAQDLLQQLGEYTPPPRASYLKRFYEPPSEAVARENSSAARENGAVAQENSAATVRHMAQTALLIESLGANSDTPTPAESTSQPLESSSQPERPNVKCIRDEHGLLWHEVSGRGPTKRYADDSLAEAEARRRLSPRR